MHTSRHLFAAVAAATIVAGALAACSDHITAAPRRVDTAPAASASRDIPAQYAWVGDEHNRFVSVALGEYDRAAQSGDRVRRNSLRHDCGALWELMAREVHASARVGRFAGQEDALLPLVRDAALRSEGCDRMAAGTVSLLAAAPATPSAPARAEATAIGDGQPWELIDAMMNQIAAARSPAAVRRIIGDAAAIAATLSPRDAEVAYAILSLVRGSFEHWSAVIPARQTALSLFLQDAGESVTSTASVAWGGIIATVAVDAFGCTSGARVVRAFDSASGWTSVAGGCLIGGGVASAGAAIAYK